MGIGSIIVIALLIYLGYLLYNNKLPKFNLSNLFKSRQNEYTDIDVEYNRRKNIEINEINRILDKITRVGFDGLTPKEKQFLKSKRK